MVTILAQCLKHVVELPIVRRVGSSARLSDRHVDVLARFVRRGWDSGCDLGRTNTTSPASICHSWRVRSDDPEFTRSSRSRNVIAEKSRFDD